MTEALPGWLVGMVMASSVVVLIDSCDCMCVLGLGVMSE